MDNEITHKPPDAAGLIRRLKEDYQRKNHSRLTQELGAITQDYISRGLASSSAHVADRRAAHLRYVAGLVDHVVESLPDARGDIPLSDLHSEVGRLLEAEYSRVSSDVNATLVNAGLAWQDVMGQFQAGIDKSLGEKRKQVETVLAEQAASLDAAGAVVGGDVEGNVVTSTQFVTRYEQGPSSGSHYDRWVQKAKNHPVVAALIVLAIIVGFLLSQVESILNIWDSIHSPPAAEVNSPSERPPAVADPNVILQGGEVVGTVVGGVGRRNGNVVFEMLTETLDLDRKRPFDYRGAKYELINAPKRKVLYISSTGRVFENVLHDVVCVVSE